MKKRNMILVIIMMFALAGCASLDEEVKKDSANTITKEEYGKRIQQIRIGVISILLIKVICTIWQVKRQ